MFGRWFRRGLSVADQVRLDAAACQRGLAADVAAVLAAGDAVLVLVRNAGDLSDGAAALAAHAPLVRDDAWAAGELLVHLATPGALGLSRVDALRAVPAASGPRAPLQVHVRGRDPGRAGDARLLALLAPWAPARVVFHHALDDALLRPHAGQLGPLLERDRKSVV